jgi:hypothetical protein
MSDENGPEVDVSDLREYDVPDPPDVRGGCVAAVAIIGLGLTAAWTVLSATAPQHYLSVYQSPGEYSSQRRIAREYFAALPVEKTRDLVLAIEDPATRGAFHEVLASTGDEAHASTIGAYILSLLEGYAGYRERELVKEACVSLGTFPPAVAAPALFAAHAKAKDEMAEAIGEVIEALPPEVVLPAVLAIPDAADRGRWHTVLASSGDPAQIDAIIAFVARESSAKGRRFEAEAKSLLKFGEKGTEQLKVALQRDEKPVVNLAAEALREVNLPFLTTYCRAELIVYGKSVYGEAGLANAHRINSLFKQQQEEIMSGKRKITDMEVTGKQNTAALAVLKAGNDRSLRCFQMLKALGPVSDNEEVDFCFIQGLSSFDQAVAQHCAGSLQRRLTPEQLIDALFRFIAKKSEFNVAEVAIYERMLTQTGATGATRIGENLERLLTGAEGDPGEVFWIYKRMGITVLAATGTKAQLPILAKYAKDTDSYQKTSRNAVGRTSRTEVRYADEIRKAVAAITKRGK